MLASHMYKGNGHVHVLFAQNNLVSHIVGAAIISHDLNGNDWIAALQQHCDVR